MAARPMQRNDASGDLGTSANGVTWANDTGFDIASSVAVPNSTGIQVPNMAVA